jgi:hypothetical protein
MPLLLAYADSASLTTCAYTCVKPGLGNNNPDVLAAEIPATNGVCTARALARFCAALIGEIARSRVAELHFGSRLLVMSAPDPALPQKLSQHDNDITALYEIAQRIDQKVEGIDQRVEALASRVDEGFTAMGQKLDAVLARLGNDGGPTAG